MRKYSGLSLIELLVVVAVIAILGGLALPGFSQLTRSTQVTQAHSGLRQALMLARSEAVRQATPVSLYAAQGHWENGWSVFIDSNGNGVPDAGDTILSESAAGGRSVTVRNTGSGVVSLITYNASGRSVQPNGAFLARTFVACATDAAVRGYKLVIARGGRLRTERLPADAAECS